MNPSPDLPAVRTDRSSRWPLVVALILTLACFWPVAGFEFSSWDDGINVTENVRLNPPRLSNVGWFWTHSFQKLYIPLAYSAWTLVAIVAQTNTADVSGVRLNPYVFHLANLLLHLLAVVIVYSILRHLIRRLVPNADPPRRIEWCAAIAAALFAIHPLQVEPVAWITGFRDVLSGLFALLAIQQYLVARDQPARSATHLILATLAFIAAMLCKPMAACVPIIVASIDLLVFRRSARRVALSVLPWIVLAIPIFIAARIAQPSELQIASSPVWSRPLIAGDALAFYLSKLVLPVRLAMDYGRTPQFVLAHAWIFATWIAPASLAIVAWFCRKRAPWLAAGLAIFVASLLPVLGLIPFNFQAYSTVADRYVYIAMLGPCVALAGFLATTRRPRAACVASSILIIVLAIRAHQQVWVWRDDLSLYRATLAVNPNSYTANNNLAVALLEHARPGDAIFYAKRATELGPGYSRTWVNLADCLALTGNDKAAIPVYHRALELEPTHAAARAKLALALASVGRIDAAGAEFDRAVHDDPDQQRLASELHKRIQAHGSSAPDGEGRP